MKKKRKTMRMHLILPLFGLLIIQALLIIGVILYGGVSKKLKDNAIRILNENTENNRLYVEKETIHRWMGFVNDSSSVAGQIQAILDEEGRKPSDISSDPALNKEIVNHVIGDIISLLQQSNATGVFLVLDGPAAENSPADTKAGFYIRGLSNGNNVTNKASLLLERGLPSLAKYTGIPLDSFWELGFDMSQKDETTSYFHKPFDAAVANHASPVEFSNYAYLNGPFRLTSMDLEVITYSVPVILDDGTVVGVFGMDMTVAQLQRLLEGERTDSENDELYVVARQNAGEKVLTPMVTSDSMPGGSFSERKPLNYTVNEDEKTNLLVTEDGVSWFASIKKLDIYNYNTPFASEEWVLMGASRKSDLLSFYHTIRTMLLVSLLVPVVFSLMGVAVIGKMATDPIRNLVMELRKKSGVHGLSLKRVNINEIDELTETIEKLSADVERSASKISTILENANVMIGVFEFTTDSPQIFASRSLCEMLGWEIPEEPYVYIPKDAFDYRFQASVKMKKREGDMYLFCTLSEERRRWMRLILDYRESMVLGVLSDVTADQEEKAKLEWERNYDILTSIYNRRAFKERVELILKENPDREAAVVVWDLDNLKYINDTYGHDEGDRYIVLFAQNLKDLEQGGGMISRYSGDEFVTLLYDESGREGIRERIRMFMRRLQSCVLKIDEDYSIPLRVSGGVAWYPDDAAEFSMLFNFADFAMYTVKHSVKGIVMEFDRDEYSSNSYMLAGREELNRLLENGSVRFAFQPIVTRNGDIYGYELLMRPEFINLKGINEVLNLAKAQAKLSQMEGLTWKAGLTTAKFQSEKGALDGNARLFINSIASVCMTEADEREVEEQFKEFLPRIVMEMTENEPMSEESLEHKKQVIERWNAMIAIDDYGAGYNGESNLLAIEPGIVKVDINLIRCIDEDTNRQAILKGILDFARANKILVLAEGVETIEELDYLVKYGVDLFQGFYIGRPYMEIRPVDSYAVEKMRALAEKYGV